MQASSRSSTAVKYRYRRRDTEEEEEKATRRAEQDAEATEEEVSEVQQEPVSPASSPSPSTSQNWLDQFNSKIRDAASAGFSSLSSQPAVAAGIAAGVAVTSTLVWWLVSPRKNSRANKQQGARAAGGARRERPAQQQGQTAAGVGAAAADAAVSVSSSSGQASKGSKAKKAAAGPPAPPGPNSKLKPTANCVPLSDGSAVVVRRPIAADNSCLFNAVGYCMHHSTNRAPFLRQVVSREVSSDPQEYSAAFLGMENAAYCAWITNPAHWGGGIELAILASHYHREVAAWNLASGACHTFGEERGFTKRVMVIYNGVHYDALAIAASPKASEEDDITEFNPRTKRGKMILAAAQQLVQLNRKGKHSLQEEKERSQREQQAAAAANSSSKPAANGPTSSSNSSSTPPPQMLVCGSCGEQLAGMEAAKAHAAATGHVEFAEMA